MENSKGNAMQGMHKNLKSKNFHRSTSSISSGKSSAKQEQQKPLNQQNDEKIPCLMFSNLPATAVKEDIMKICTPYGRVTAVRFNEKLKKFFVDFARTADMETAWRALEINDYNFKVTKAINHCSRSQMPNHPPQNNASFTDRKSNNFQRPQQEGDMNNKHNKKGANNTQGRPANGSPMKTPGNQTQNFGQMKSPPNQGQKFGPSKAPLQNFGQMENPPNQGHQGGPSKTPYNQMQRFGEMKSPPNQGQKFGQNKNPFNQVQNAGSMERPSNQGQKFGQNKNPFNQVQNAGSMERPSNQGHQVGPSKTPYNQMQRSGEMKSPPNQGQKFGPNKTPFNQAQRFGENQKGKYQGNSNKSSTQFQAEIIEKKKMQYKAGNCENNQTVEQPKYYEEYQLEITPGKPIKPVGKLNLPSSINEGAENLIKRGRMGKCTVCEHTSTLTCAACGTFICSEACLKRTWENHRLVCKKISYETANGKRIVEPKNSELPFPELPNSGSMVCITCVTKADVVFVRPTSEVEDYAFLDLLSKINLEGGTLPVLLTAPKVGQIVVGQFDKSFYRAQVLDATNKLKIRIIFLDFGDLAEKPIYELYETPEDYMYIPRIVTPVILKGVPDLHLSVSVRNHLKASVEKVKFKIKYSVEDFQKEKSAYIVELLDVMTKKTFNELINEMCTPQKEEFKLKYLPLTIGKNVKLVILNNSKLTDGYLHCCLVTHVQEIKKIQEEIQKYMTLTKATTEHVPGCGEYCLVKNNADGDWYRGQILSLVGTNFCSVQLLDIGVEKTVIKTDICNYPEQLDFPIGTILCKIKDFPQECNKSITKCLKASMPEFETINCEEIVPTVDEKGDACYILRVDEILKAVSETTTDIIE